MPRPQLHLRRAQPSESRELRAEGNLLALAGPRIGTINPGINVPSQVPAREGLAGCAGRNVPLNVPLNPAGWRALGGE